MLNADPDGESWNRQGQFTDSVPTGHRPTSRDPSRLSSAWLQGHPSRATSEARDEACQGGLRVSSRSIAGCLTPAQPETGRSRIDQLGCRIVLGVLPSDLPIKQISIGPRPFAVGLALWWVLGHGAAEAAYSIEPIAPCPSHSRFSRRPATWMTTARTANFQLLRSNEVKTPTVRKRLPQIVVPPAASAAPGHAPASRLSSDEARRIAREIRPWLDEYADLYDRKKYRPDVYTAVRREFRRGA